MSVWNAEATIIIIIVVVVVVVVVVIWDDLNKLKY